jgi:hypothetical protein
MAVVRENCDGPIRLDIQGLPDDILASETYFIPPEDGSFTLKLRALPEAAPLHTRIRVVATLEKVRAEGEFLLTIKPKAAPPLPTGSLSVEVVKQLSLLPFQSITFKVGVRRKDYNGPVTLTIEDLPAKVGCKPVELPADSGETEMEIIATDAAPETYTIKVAAKGGMLRAEEKVNLSIMARSAIEVLPVQAVAVEQGKKVVVEVKVKRVNCEGAVEVRLEGLPEGVVGGRPFFIGESEDSGRLTLFAEVDAAVARKVVRVRARLKELEAETTFEITVEKAVAPVVMRFPAAPLPRPNVNPRLRRGWGPEQAVGPPDTHPASGDLRTAWASATPDGQDEWLLLEYDQPVQPVAVAVYETFNPGAVTKVSVFKEDGTEVEVWSGRDPVNKGIAMIPLKLTFKVTRVLLHIESTRVPGCNEIDAVALIEANRKVHYAAAALASSTYADNAAPPR